MRKINVNGSFNVKFTVTEKLSNSDPTIEEISSQVKENFIVELKKFLIGEGGFNTCDINDLELEITEEF